MKIESILAQSYRHIDFWLTELDRFNMEELTRKPNDEEWSLGQVFNHLINASLNFHLQQVDICLKTTKNRFKFKNIRGFVSYYLLKGFPPIKIKVPPSPEYTPNQPNDKAEIIHGMEILKIKLREASERLTLNPKSGKTPHPGFSYLSANEWFQLIEMHFRHHLHQKARLEAFLL